MTNLMNLIERAQIGRTVEGQHIQVAETVLMSGVLICYLRYRSSNSRGARRGRGHDVRFNFKAHGEQYAKSVTKARALEILKTEG